MLGLARGSPANIPGCHWHSSSVLMDMWAREGVMEMELKFWDWSKNKSDKEEFEFWRYAWGVRIVIIDGEVLAGIRIL